MSGLFISFEGGEGSGKSSAITAVKNKLEADGYKVVITREPGGVSVSEQIRNVLLAVNNQMSKETEALLYAASRMQHLKERVIPAINDGTVVICDRFLDSSLAYQGHARGLGMEAILRINHFALDHLPDLTIFIDVKPEVALKRLANRDKSDRLDLESIKFHQDVYDGYIKVAEMYPDRVLKIDGNRELEEVCNDCVNKVLEFIGR